jgi:hypothetical protein
MDNGDRPVGNQFEDIRKRALEALTPIVDTIDAGPEKKFELLMTAARFSGQSDTLDKALTAALGISDPTEKAEALIDIVNETNYQLRDSDQR